MKIKYPIEAFALAMIIFSRNLKEALLTGMIILIVSLLGALFHNIIGRGLPLWSRRACNFILVVALNYSLFKIVLLGIFHIRLDESATFILIMIGVLIGKYCLCTEELDIGRLLIEGACAFVAITAVGLVREFIAEGRIFGITIISLNFMSRAYQNIVFGFMFSGIAIAILNYFFDNKSKKWSSLWVVIPPFLINNPFVFRNMDESLSVLLTVLIALILFLSVKEYILFSKTSKDWRRLPVDLVAASIIYMILRIF